MNTQLGNKIVVTGKEGRKVTIVGTDMESIAELDGAGLWTRDKDAGKYAIEVPDSKKRTKNGDRCLLAQLDVSGLSLISEDAEQRCYTATLTKVNAYPSYDRDPIFEKIGGYSYMPPKHKIQHELPVQVLVTVSR